MLFWNLSEESVIMDFCVPEGKKGHFSYCAFLFFMFPGGHAVWELLEKKMFFLTMDSCSLKVLGGGIP